MSRVRPGEATGSAEACVLVLQGGGALGAYQAGVFQVLAERARVPDWVAGISIGAVNAALIAGNPPERRVQALEAFWQRVTTLALPRTPAAPTELQLWFNRIDAGLGLVLGQPAFFVPRWPTPLPHWPRPTGTLSYYDTAPLRRTLEELVDFDLLNSGRMRLSVGVVNLRTGNFSYFDTARQRLDVRHIMASGALPPGFPPVEIDGEWYWDGGLVSTTPLDYVLDQPGNAQRLVFQVDLFQAEGTAPRTLIDVAEREKDIRYSSRTRLNTTNAVRRQRMAEAARNLLARLPEAFRDDPDAALLREATEARALTVVHLIHRRKAYESQSKDYEFSRWSMLRHWAAGRDDMTRTLEHPDWLTRKTGAAGVQVFDLTRNARRHQADRSRTARIRQQPQSQGA